MGEGSFSAGDPRNIQMDSILIASKSATSIANQLS